MAMSKMQRDERRWERRDKKLLEQARKYMTERANTVYYELPNKEVVGVQRDLCRMASVISYTMKDGQVVNAIICAGQH